MTDAPSVQARPETSPAGDRRWWILAVLAIAQLMIVVDASIVNIALPHAQRALHITTANRQWVITAYTLTFGGLLLLGGPHRRLRRAQAHPAGRSARVRGSVGARRPGARRQPSVRRPGPAGGVRGPDGAGGALAGHRHLHRGPGTGPGLRRLGSDRRRRPGHRAGARRRAHPVRLLAVVPAGQHADRLAGRRPQPCA